MKNIHPNLQNHLNQTVTTLATCYQISRVTGEVLCFTSHDTPLQIAGKIFQPANTLKASSLETTADLRADNLEIQGGISEESIKREQLLSGAYDNARVDIFMVNYQHLPEEITPQSCVWLQSGYIEKIRLGGSQFVAELRSITTRLERSRLDLYTPTCRAKRLGDAACKVNMSIYSHNHAVTEILSERSFKHNGTQRLDGYFTAGILRRTSGANQTTEIPVKAYENHIITLQEVPFYPIAVGQSFMATRGCNRHFATCRDVFNNVVNFRGEPPHLLPGSDKINSPLG